MTLVGGWGRIAPIRLLRRIGTQDDFMAIRNIQYGFLGEGAGGVFFGHKEYPSRNTSLASRCNREYPVQHLHMAPGMFILVEKDSETKCRRNTKLKGRDS